MFIYKVQKHPGRTEQGNDGKNAEDLEGSVDGEKLSQHWLMESNGGTLFVVTELAYLN